jgi:hypothetical protein
MKITKIDAVGIHKPICTFKVRVASHPTYEKQRRIYRQEKDSLPVDQCSIRADFMVDGEPRCRIHAGKLALDHLLEKSTKIMIKAPLPKGMEDTPETREKISRFLSYMPTEDLVT